jgi:hypothetical protein
MKYVSTRHIAIFILSLFIFSFTAGTTEAANINTDATVLNESHTKGLFVVVFTLRAFGNDMYLPLSAVRTGMPGSESAGAVFSIVSNGDALTATGTTQSLILSTTTIENGMYKIKNGSRATFALATFLTTPGTEEARYRVVLPTLRYYTDAAGTKPVLYDLSGNTLRTKSLSLTK